VFSRHIPCWRCLRGDVVTKHLDDDANNFVLGPAVTTTTVINNKSLKFARIHEARITVRVFMFLLAA